MIDRAFLSVLVCGAEKVFDNAESLYAEAGLLTKSGAIARALCLHQVSLEECSKVESLGAWATGLLAGFKVDKRRFFATFRSHSSKNMSNAYMLRPSRAEVEARASGDWHKAREEFGKSQNDFHQASNEAKNASLYVDWKDGAFVTPSERITPEMLARSARRNEKFLSYAYNGVQMLKRLDKSPEDLQDLIAEFVEAAEKIRSDKPDNLMTAGDELIRRFLDAGLKRLRNK